MIILLLLGAGLAAAAHITLVVVELGGCLLGLPCQQCRHTLLLWGLGALVQLVTEQTEGCPLFLG